MTNTYPKNAKLQVKIYEELRCIRCVLERILNTLDSSAFVDYEMEKFSKKKHGIEILSVEEVTDELLEKELTPAPSQDNPEKGYWRCPEHGTGLRCCKKAKWREKIQRKKGVKP